MKSRIAAACLVVAALWLSGCAGAGARPESTAGRTTSAPPPIVDEDFGSIAGVVVDDQAAPIRGARVQVIETRADAATDAAGRFTFNNLTPADYRVVVELLGYSSGAKKAKVVAGEVTDLTFNLEPLIIMDEPYIRTVPRSGFINVGFYALNTALRIVNDSTVNGLTCSQCSFIAHYEKAPPPAQIILESLWTASVGGPFVNEQIDVDWSTPSATGWTYYGTTVMRTRSKLVFNEAATKEYQKHDRILFEIMAALGGGIVVNQKMDFFISFAHVEPAPDDFTALPPR